MRILTSFLDSEYTQIVLYQFFEEYFQKYLRGGNLKKKFSVSVETTENNLILKSALEDT